MKIRCLVIVVTFICYWCCGDLAAAQNVAGPTAAVSAPQSSPEGASTEYKIGSGNVLQVDVYNGKGEKISQIVRVSSDGGISLPFVGEMVAAGRTVPQLQREVKERLVKNDFVSSNVVVFVQEFSTVTIVGEVTRSGTYPFKGHLTITELIAMAGGLNEYASADEVKVIHSNPDGTKSNNVIRLYDLMNTNSTDNEGFPLSPDDVVIVPRSVVSIMGEVNRPGIFPTRGRLTIIELITMAGGFSKFASPNDVKVTHTNADGTKSRLVIKVKDILNKGSGENDGLVLSSGDLVYVPSGIY